MKRSTKSLPKPPTGLSKTARSWWTKIVSDWDLDDSALLVLEHALQALDRVLEAREAIKKDGAVTKDRFGQLKLHPATYLERDSRAAMLAALKQLRLDIEPLNDSPGRPPGK